MMAGKLRDCIFWVADNTMAEVFKTFLTREKFHLSLGCGPFEFDPREVSSRMPAATIRAFMSAHTIS
jgi:hypothetical protein